MVIKIKSLVNYNRTSQKIMELLQKEMINYVTNYQVDDRTVIPILVEGKIIIKTLERGSLAYASMAHFKARNLLNIVMRHNFCYGILTDGERIIIVGDGYYDVSKFSLDNLINVIKELLKRCRR